MCGASGRGAFYAFACVCAAVQLRHGLERGSLCGSAFTAARAHTAAKHGRARTPTQSKLAPAVTYVHCNKLRCTYVQRALHVTHVLAYATGTLRLSCPSARCWSFLFSLYILFYLFLSLLLICTYIPTRIHTYIYMYIPRFSLSVLFSLSVNVSIPLQRWSVHIARSRYTRRSAHTRPRRVHAGVGHVRDALFARGATFAFYASCARGATLELYTLFSDLLRRAFRYTPLNKGNRKTATARSPCVFRKVEMLRRACLW